VGGCPGFKIIYFAYIFAMATASMQPELNGMVIISFPPPDNPNEGKNVCAAFIVREGGGGGGFSSAVASTTTTTTTYTQSESQEALFQQEGA